MYKDFYKIESNGLTPQKGMFLLAEPFMRNSFFTRSVILLISHNEEGSMGLVLNQTSSDKLNDFVPEFNYLEKIPLYQGGPIGNDRLFFVHNLYEEIRDSIKLNNDYWLNGNLEDIKDYVLQGHSLNTRIRFVKGYAGWSPNQLQEEIDSGSWLLTPTIDPNQFSWKKAMQKLGGKYAVWAKFPIFPSFN